MVEKLLTEWWPKLIVILASRASCCVILGTVILILVAACAIDRDAIARKRENLELLCTDPRTVLLKDLCARVAPDLSGHVDLTQPE